MDRSSREEMGLGSNWAPDLSAVLFSTPDYERHDLIVPDASITWSELLRLVGDNSQNAATDAARYPSAFSSDRRYEYCSSSLGEGSHHGSSNAGSGHSRKRVRGNMIAMKPKKSVTGGAAQHYFQSRSRSSSPARRARKTSVSTKPLSASVCIGATSVASAVNPEHTSVLAAVTPVSESVVSEDIAPVRSRTVDDGTRRRRRRDQKKEAARRMRARRKQELEYLQRQLKKYETLDPTKLLEDVEQLEEEVRMLKFTAAKIVDISRSCGVHLTVPANIVEETGTPRLTMSGDEINRLKSLMMTPDLEMKIRCTAELGFAGLSGFVNVVKSSEVSKGSGRISLQSRDPVITASSHLSVDDTGVRCLVRDFFLEGVEYDVVLAAMRKLRLDERLPDHGDMIVRVKCATFGPNVGLFYVRTCIPDNHFPNGGFFVQALYENSMNKTSIIHTNADFPELPRLWPDRELRVFGGDTIERVPNGCKLVFHTLIRMPLSGKTLMNKQEAIREFLFHEFHAEIKKISLLVYGREPDLVHDEDGLLGTVIFKSEM